MLSAEAQKRAPGPEASILKIKGTEVQQALSELMMYAVGPYALPFDRGSREEGDLRSIAGPAYAAPLAATYCNYRKVSIYGGSNEIQRNIISQMILGLYTGIGQSWISISPKSSSCSPTPCGGSCASIIRSKRAAKF